MLKRKVIQQLRDWKDTPGKKPLVIKGCRQCGKTFAVRTFANDNYNYHCPLRKNFESQKKHLAEKYLIGEVLVV